MRLYMLVNSKIVIIGRNKNNIKRKWNKENLKQLREEMRNAVHQLRFNFCNSSL